MVPRAVTVAAPDAAERGRRAKRASALKRPAARVSDSEEVRSQRRVRQRPEADAAPAAGDIEPFADNADVAIDAVNDVIDAVNAAIDADNAVNAGPAAGEDVANDAEEGELQPPARGAGQANQNHSHGCSKCRWIRKGCKQCRAWAAEGKNGRSIGPNDEVMISG